MEMYLTSLDTIYFVLNHFEYYITILQNIDPKRPEGLDLLFLYSVLCTEDKSTLPSCV